MANWPAPGGAPSYGQTSEHEITQGFSAGVGDKRDQQCFWHGTSFFDSARLVWPAFAFRAPRPGGVKSHSGSAGVDGRGGRSGGGLGIIRSEWLMRRRRAVPDQTKR